MLLEYLFLTGIGGRGIAERGMRGELTVAAPGAPGK